MAAIGPNFVQFHHEMRREYFSVRIEYFFKELGSIVPNTNIDGKNCYRKK